MFMFYQRNPRPAYNYHSRARAASSPQNRGREDVSLEIPNILSVNNIDNISSIEVNTIDVNNLDFNIQHETNFRNKLKNFLKDILSYQYISIIIALTFLLAIQGDVASMKDALNVFRISVGLHLILMIRCYAQTKDKPEKRKYLFQLAKDALYLLMMLSYNLENVDSSFVSLALIVLILLTNFLSTWGLFMRYRESYHKFIRYLNVKFFHMRMLFWIQLLCVVLRLLITRNNLRWNIVLIPLYIIIIYQGYILVWLTRIMNSNAGKLFFKSKTLESKFRPIVGILMIFLFFICLEIWGIVVFTLSFDNVISIQNAIPLLATIIFFNIFTIIYIHKKQLDILFISKSLAALFEFTPDQLLKIKETLEKSKAAPKEYFFLKISNTFYKPYTIGETINKKGYCSKRKLKKILKKAEKSLQAPSEKPETSEPETKCMICFEKKPSSIFDCGHGGICNPCGLAIAEAKKECHMCRKKITNLYELEPPNIGSQIYKVVTDKKI